MNANVSKSNKNTFLVIIDDEALEVLNRISAIADERPIEIIRRFVLGGIALQCIIDIHSKIEALQKKRNRWYYLSNILDLFRR